MFPNEKERWRVAIKIFADDVSAAVGHKDKEVLYIIIWKLREALHQILMDLDLEESLPK